MNDKMYLKGQLLEGTLTTVMVINYVAWMLIYEVVTF